MSASKVERAPLTGDLAVTSVTEVLSRLEAERCEGRVRFETEVGSAEVELRGGVIVGAKLAELTGKKALFRLLGVVDGSFEVSRESIAERPALGASVAQLTDERSQRFLAWRRLSERAPSPWAVLTLTELGEKERAEGLAAEDELVLGLVNGERTLTDIVGASPLDAVDVLTQVVQALERGALTVAGQPVGEAAREPKASEAPRGMRKRTEIGLGISESVGRGMTEVRRIISITSQPPPAEYAPASVLSVPPPPPPGALELGDGHDANPPQESGEVPSARVREALARSSRRGRYVGRYELLCPIGRGGMGSVYLGRLTSEGGFRRLFAVKLLRRHLLEDSAAAQRFLDEARVAGHIHHPNVVSVTDAGFHGSQPYLVMDYIEGASFKELLSKHPHTRAPERILPIVLDALAGLHASHTLVDDDGAPIGLVHCDVSPENLLVGVDGVCRLLDFGVARSATLPTEREPVTRGKPGYLAPEQILGAPVDPRTDVFAMGIVLYNAITGVRLFESATVEETMRQVCIQRIEPPSTVGLKPPPALDFVCMRALDREPDRRFSSAEEMMIELRRVALREGLLASSTDIASWVRESVGRELAERRLFLLETRKSAAPPPPVPSALNAPAREPELPIESRREEGPQQNLAIVLHRGVEREELALAPLVSPAGEDEDEDEVENEKIPQASAAAGLAPDTKRLLLVGASVLALLLVAATLLWPELVSRVFRMETERVDAPATREAPTGTNLAPR